MKAQCAPMLLLSFFLIAAGSTPTGTNEASRLHAMTRSRRSAPPRHKAEVQSDIDPTEFSVPVASQDGLMEADRIASLPGQPEGVNFSQYAGYVTVDPKPGRALFYYFAEAAHNSSEKPLVLWLNGGPGCSSLGGGAMLELGPFFVNKDGKTLYKNDYAWNNVANMLFLESPAGVGFSYSNASSDYDKSGDNRTAADSYTFLVNWLERFPQYKGRDFFIAGESYAGHYIPHLANVIVANNNRTNATTINLKGIAIGNAYLDDGTNDKGNYEYYWTHAMMSKETHESIQANCNFTSQASYSAECTSALDLANEEIGKIDPYDIYAPVCHKSSPLQSDDGANAADPCSDRYVSSYLNLAEVQRALHANTTRLRYPWSECSGLVGSTNWEGSPATMLPAIKQVIESGARVWLFSGDIDSVVSVTATQYFLDDLKLPVETSWHAWYTDDQVGGYVVGYKGLVFATVREAGHMVPRYQPKRALTIFSSFLQGKLPR